jgi:CheY-like chemotaxis protein
MKFSSSAHPTILLVADNRDGLLVRRALLEEQGFEVQIACNGQEGLELFDRCRFDIVLTDFRMPAMSGVEFIRQIRERKPHTPIVLLSGLVEPLGLTEQNTGADAVIAKNSYEAAHLVRCVKRLIHRGPSRKPPATQPRSLARARA